MRFLTLSGSAISIYVTYPGYFASKIVRSSGTLVKANVDPRSWMYICVVRAPVCTCVYVRSTIIRECSLKLRKNEEKGERTREEGRGGEKKEKEKEYSSTLRIDSSGAERSSPPISGETSDGFPVVLFSGGGAACNVCLKSLVVLPCKRPTLSYTPGLV